MRCDWGFENPVPVDKNCIKADKIRPKTDKHNNRPAYAN